MADRTHLQDAGDRIFSCEHKILIVDQRWLRSNNRRGTDIVGKNRQTAWKPNQTDRRFPDYGIERLAEVLIGAMNKRGGRTHPGAYEGIMLRW